MYVWVCCCLGLAWLKTVCITCNPHEQMPVEEELSAVKMTGASEAKLLTEKTLEQQDKQNSSHAVHCAHAKLQARAPGAVVRICLLDNRGVGRSSSPASRQAYSTSIMADDCIAVLVSVASQPAFLLLVNAASNLEKCPLHHVLFGWQAFPTVANRTTVANRMTKCHEKASAWRPSLAFEAHETLFCTWL